MKWALRMCSLDGKGKYWDEFVLDMAMGCSKSRLKTIGCSPYFLLFGRDPILWSRLLHLGGWLDPIAATGQGAVPAGAGWGTRPP